MPDDNEIYCADCKYCSVIEKQQVVQNQYTLRVRCDKEKWKKKLGEDKFYKYFTVARRTMDFCDAYEQLDDDPKEYLKELKKYIPIKDEVYTY